MSKQASGVFLWSTCEVLLDVAVSAHLTRSFEETPGDTRLLSASSSLHLCGLCLCAAASNHHLQRVDSMSLLDLVHIVGRESGVPRRRVALERFTRGNCPVLL